MSNKKNKDTRKRIQMTEHKRLMAEESERRKLLHRHIKAKQGKIERLEAGNRAQIKSDAFLIEEGLKERTESLKLVNDQLDSQSDIIASFLEWVKVQYPKKEEPTQYGYSSDRPLVPVADLNEAKCRIIEHNAKEAERMQQCESEKDKATATTNQSLSATVTLMASMKEVFNT